MYPHCHHKKNLEILVHKCNLKKIFLWGVLIWHQCSKSVKSSKMRIYISSGALFKQLCQWISNSLFFFPWQCQRISEHGLGPSRHTGTGGTIKVNIAPISVNVSGEAGVYLRMCCILCSHWLDCALYRLSKLWWPTWLLAPTSPHCEDKNKNKNKNLSPLWRQNDLRCERSARSIGAMLII